MNSLQGIETEQVISKPNLQREVPNETSTR